MKKLKAKTAKRPAVKKPGRVPSGSEYPKGAFGDGKVVDRGKKK